MCVSNHSLQIIQRLVFFGSFIRYAAIDSLESMNVNVKAQ